MVHQIYVLGSIHSYYHYSSPARGGHQCSYVIQTAPPQLVPQTVNSVLASSPSLERRDRSRSSPIEASAAAAWTLLEGQTRGCTQSHSSIPSSSASLSQADPYGTCSTTSTWNHPIDVVYASSGIAGWPRIRLRVDGMDRFGRRSLVGYGNCFCPGFSSSCEGTPNRIRKSTKTSNSQQIVEVVILKPRRQGILNRLHQLFLGYDGEDFDLDFSNCYQEEEDLIYDSVGVVHLNLDVLWKQL